MSRTRTRLRQLLGVAITAALVAATPPLPSVGADAPPIYPGGPYVAGGGGSCSIGFLLARYEQDPVRGRVDSGDRYFVTAGHCFVDRGATTWGPGVGPAATLDELELGRAVYAEKDWSAHIDVALVLMTPGVEFDPAVCYWGGPTHVVETLPTRGDRLLLSGTGGLIRPREMIAADGQDTWSHYNGYDSGGDSGGAVMDAEGGAVGIHSVFGVTLGEEGLLGASRFPAMLDRVQDRIDIDLELLTAPLADVSFPSDVLDHDCAHRLGIP